ncbi:hypothetical protein K3495_g3039 [Podosphaera aphanis]|nr:hypothetical protein K3495_g3039 [Podosphaera aphanis]
MHVSILYTFLCLQLVSKFLPTHGFAIVNTTCIENKVVCLAKESLSALKEATRPYHGIVRNELLEINGTDCPTIGIIFARGTLEPGNVGILTGPPFFEAMADYLNETNQIAVQGVDYDANIPSFLLGGSEKGASTMANLVRLTTEICPTTSLILSGYSQGAQVVHKAADTLTPDLASKITAVVLFGDPMNGTALSSIDPARVKTICDDTDEICGGKLNINYAHLEYGLNATAAAMFVLQRFAQMGIAS